MISTNNHSNDILLYSMALQGLYITIFLEMHIMLLKMLLKDVFSEQASAMIKDEMQTETLIINISIFLHGLGRLTCYGVNALPSFPGASRISSSSGFVLEGVFRESVVFHPFKVLDPILSQAVYLSL